MAVQGFVISTQLSLHVGDVIILDQQAWRIVLSRSVYCYLSWLDRYAATVLELGVYLH